MVMVAPLRGGQQGRQQGGGLGDGLAAQPVAVAAGVAGQRDQPGRAQQAHVVVDGRAGQPHRHGQLVQVAGAAGQGGEDALALLVAEGPAEAQQALGGGRPLVAVLAAGRVADDPGVAVLAEQEPRPGGQVGDEQHPRALRLRLVGEPAADQLDQPGRGHGGGQLAGGQRVGGQQLDQAGLAGRERLLVPAGQRLQQAPPGLVGAERQQHGQGLAGGAAVVAGCSSRRPWAARSPAAAAWMTSAHPGSRRRQAGTSAPRSWRRTSSGSVASRRASSAAASLGPGPPWPGRAGGARPPGPVPDLGQGGRSPADASSLARASQPAAAGSSVAAGPSPVRTDSSIRSS